MRFKLPANLKLQKLIGRYPPDQIKGFSGDKVYFVCHSIIQQMAKLDENCFYPGVRFQYYVPLSATVLKRMLGNNYGAVTFWMERVGIIQIYRQYEVGKQSIKYRLCNRYNTGKHTWKSASTFKFSKVKQDGMFSMKERKCIFEPRLIGKLQKQFTGLKIDEQKALAHISKLYAEEHEQILSGPATERQPKINKLRIKRMAYKHMIDRFNRQVRFYLTSPDIGYIRLLQGWNESLGSTLSMTDKHLQK